MKNEDVAAISLFRTIEPKYVQGDVISYYDIHSRNTIVTEYFGSKMSSFRNNQSNSSSKIPIVTTTVSEKPAVDLPPIDSGELMMKVIRSPIGLGYFLAFFIQRECLRI